MVVKKAVKKKVLIEVGELDPWMVQGRHTYGKIGGALFVLENNYKTLAEAKVMVRMLLEENGKTKEYAISPRQIGKRKVFSVWYRTGLDVPEVDREDKPVRDKILNWFKEK